VVRVNNSEERNAEISEVYRIEENRWAIHQLIKVKTLLMMG